ncbi:MAG TPA: Maf family protein [Burkholderiales bacterium]|jgi:septum formation protein|nr:Maf family protein [Burkholderiales bacterium]
MPDKRIYLASRSPRRRELLRQIGVNFELLILREDPRRGIDVDETLLEGETAADYVMRVARAKAQVAARVALQRGLRPHPALGADTTVVLEGTVIGKPENAEHAQRILGALSGREHEVMTAVAVAQRDRIESALSVSTVAFRELAPAEVQRYVASGEPSGKAGAYAIQGRAAAFITRIAGSYSGIMGLPLAETAELLRRFDIDAL